MISVHNVQISVSERIPGCCRPPGVYGVVIINHPAFLSGPSVPNRLRWRYFFFWRASGKKCARAKAPSELVRCPLVLGRGVRDAREGKRGGHVLGVTLPSSAPPWPSSSRVHASPPSETNPLPPARSRPPRGPTTSPAPAEDSFVTGQRAPTRSTNKDGSFGQIAPGQGQHFFQAYSGSHDGGEVARGRRCHTEQ